VVGNQRNRIGADRAGAALEAMLQDLAGVLVSDLRQDRVAEVPRKAPITTAYR
jgi:hypothetical protein